jgi:hypothetical protein
MAIKDKDIISLFMNLSIASAKIKGIDVEQEGGIYKLRPQIHLILSGDRGVCKSTAINQVAKHFKTTPYNDTTEASLIGTIDTDTKEVIEGIAWSQRNSVLVYDEFEFSDRSYRPSPVINILLSLMEGEQEYKRKIAVQSKNDLIESDGDLFFKVSTGEIHVKTNFALIIGTMDPLVFQNIKLNAFKSRCIPLKWFPEKETLREVAMGRPIFNFKDLLGSRRINKVVKVSAKDYNRIVDFVGKNCEDVGMYLRAIGDCVRVFAILKKHDEGLYSQIIEYKTTID